MTKDRRLGKGLAALLGSPLEEDSIVDGAARTDQGPQAAGAPARTAGAAMRNKPSTPSGVTGAVPLAASPSAPESAPQSSASTLELSVYEIDNNPFQPRRKFNEDEIGALAESIREHQQLQPILVRKVGSRYQLISGERRLRATIHAGLPTIRAEIREADDRLVAELAIVENLQRKDLDAIEKALSFRRYLDEHECKQDDLAKRLKIDRSTIANLMRLLELPQDIQRWIQQEKVSAGHARALLPLGDEDQQLSFANRIVEEGWSVRETERQVGEHLDAEDSFMPGKSGKGKPRPSTSPQVAALEQQLRLALGTKTEIRQNARGRGKISITFANTEEFERIFEILCPTQTHQRAA